MAIFSFFLFFLSEILLSDSGFVSMLTVHFMEELGGGIVLDTL